MQNKIKNITIVIGFMAILICILIANLIGKDKQISNSERRVLAQFPEINLNKLKNGTAMKEWEDYVLDQFVARDLFRTTKSVWSMKILKQKDNNNLFVIDKAIYKMEYPLNEKNIEKSAEKINDIYMKYLQNMNVYYAIIPDKNYYLKNDDHLKIDYYKLKEIMQNKLMEMKYIDIWENLKLEDYYKTDLHWKQEKLKEVVKTIQKRNELE